MDILLFLCINFIIILFVLYTKKKKKTVLNSSPATVSDVILAEKATSSIDGTSISVSALDSNDATHGESKIEEEVKSEIVEKVEISITATDEPTVGENVTLPAIEPLGVHIVDNADDMKPLGTELPEHTVGDEAVTKPANPDAVNDAGDVVSVSTDMHEPANVDSVPAPGIESVNTDIVHNDANSTDTTITHGIIPTHDTEGTESNVVLDDSVNITDIDTMHSLRTDAGSLIRVDAHTDMHDTVHNETEIIMHTGDVVKETVSDSTHNNIDTPAVNETEQAPDAQVTSSEVTPSDISSLKYDIQILAAEISSYKDLLRVKDAQLERLVSYMHDHVPETDLDAIMDESLTEHTDESTNTTYSIADAEDGQDHDKDHLASMLQYHTDKARQAAEKLGINESNMNLSQNISHVIAGIKSQADKLVQEQKRIIDMTTREISSLKNALESTTIMYKSALRTSNTYKSAAERHGKRVRALQNTINNGHAYVISLNQTHYAQIASLKEDIANKDSRLAQMAAECDSICEKKVNEKTSEIALLEEKIAGMDAECDSLRNETVIEKEAQIASLTEEISTVNQKLVQMNTECVIRDQTIHEKDLAIALLNETTSIAIGDCKRVCEETVNGKDAEIESLKATVAKTVADCNRICDEKVTEMNATIASLNELTDRTIAECKRICEEKVNEKDAEIEQLRNTVAMNAHTHSGMEEHIQRITTELTVSSNTITNLNDHITKLTEDIQLKTTQNKALEENNEALSQRCAVLNGDNNGLRKEALQLARSLETMTADRNSIIQKNEAAAVDRNHLISQIKFIEQQKVHADAQNVALNGKNSELEATIRQYKDELGTLRETVQKRDQDILLYTQDNLRLNQTVNRLQSTMVDKVKYDSTVRSYEEYTATTTTKIQSLQTTIKTLRSQVKELQASLAQNDTTIQNNNAAISQKDTENAKLRAMNESLTKQVTDYETDHDQLYQELGELRVNKENNDTTIANLNKDLSELRSINDDLAHFRSDTDEVDIPVILFIVSQALFVVAEFKKNPSIYKDGVPSDIQPRIEHIYNINAVYVGQGIDFFDRLMSYCRKWWPNSYVFQPQMEAIMS